MGLFGDFAAAWRRGEEELALSRELGDEEGIANSLFLLGVVANEHGRFERAQPLLEESLALFEGLRDEHYTLLARFHLAWAYDELGDRRRAVVLDTETLQRARAAGNERTEALTLFGLESYARTDGRAEEALELGKQALRIYGELGERGQVPDALSRVAAALALSGKATLSARLLSSSVALYAEVRSEVPSRVDERNEKTLTTLRAQIDQAAFAEAWEQGRKLTEDEAVALALGSPD